VKLPLPVEAFQTWCQWWLTTQNLRPRWCGNIRSELMHARFARLCPVDIADIAWWLLQAKVDMHLTAQPPSLESGNWIGEGMLLSGRWSRRWSGRIWGLQANFARPTTGFRWGKRQPARWEDYGNIPATKTQTRWKTRKEKIQIDCYKSKSNDFEVCKHIHGSLVYVTASDIRRRTDSNASWYNLHISSCLLWKKIQSKLDIRKWCHLTWHPRIVQND
jgi:hypothetical protein